MVPPLPLPLTDCNFFLDEVTFAHQVVCILLLFMRKGAILRLLISKNVRKGWWCPTDPGSTALTRYSSCFCQIVIKYPPCTDGGDRPNRNIYLCLIPAKILNELEIHVLFIKILFPTWDPKPVLSLILESRGPSRQNQSEARAGSSPSWKLQLLGEMEKTEKTEVSSHD